ncbi:MAG TPA: NmrA family NAD(P)-binding protein [Polyangia bacterium]|nr:NmrA family NAD(P)-binding protein [Polyangia bacterium]
MFTIAGASGKVGSAAAETLLAAERVVRVIVRSDEKGAKWRERGAEVFVGSLDDAAFVTRALTGVEGAFLLLPPDFRGEVYERQKQLAQAMAQAVRDSQVPHVVLLSSVGAHLPSGTGVIQGLYHAEQALAKTGANVTFIRATSFMENLAGNVGLAAAQGILPWFLDEKTPIGMVATHDIGRLAAQALMNPPKGKKIYELVGPKEYSPSEIADTLGKALGKPVKLAAMPASQAAGAMVKGGVPEFLAGPLGEMTEALAAGRVKYDGAGERVRGLTSLWHVVHQLARKAN